VPGFAGSHLQWVDALAVVVQDQSGAGSVR
jgi:hypothetical protein